MPLICCILTATAGILMQSQREKRSEHTQMRRADGHWASSIIRPSKACTGVPYYSPRFTCTSLQASEEEAAGKLQSCAQSSVLDRQTQPRRVSLV